MVTCPTSIMTSNDPFPEPTLSAEAVREWNRHLESVLRGFAHALNNRAAALSAVLELSSDADESPDTTRSILNTELSRVRDLADVIRIVGPARGGSEALSPADVAEQASAILKLHADHRDRPTVIRVDSAPPIRVSRWMFVRALVTLGATARIESKGATPVTIEITGDGDWLVVRVPGAKSKTDALSPYTAELTRAMGGELLLTHGFRLPTLAAIRQRENR
jgi:hypothetical protein